MAADTQNTVQKVGAKSVHHGHDNNQRGHTQHDAEKRNNGDDGNKTLAAARAQIAPGQLPLQPVKRPRHR